MFNNIGSKLKGLAYVVTILGMLASIIAGGTMLSSAGRLNSYSYSSEISALTSTGWTIIIVGCLASWIGSFMMYGVGEAAEKASEACEQISSLQEQIKSLQSTPKEAPSAVPEQNVVSPSSAHSFSQTANTSAPYDASTAPEPPAGYINCPKCGTTQPDRRNVCWRCGTNLRSAAEPSSDSSPIA